MLVSRFDQCPRAIEVQQFKVNHCLGDFLYFTDTIQKSNASKCIYVRIPVNRCSDDTWGDGIDSDFVGCKFTCKTSG